MAFGFGKKRRRRELIDLLDDEMVGLLMPGVEMEGKMRVTVNAGLVRVNTHFKGEIECEGTIAVNDQGEVEADIRTKVLSVKGKVKGTIHASERLEIMEHGVVLGDIYTPCLIIDPGGYFDGTCHMPTPEPEKSTAPAVESKDRP